MTRRTIRTLAALVSAGGLALGWGAAHAQANLLTDLGAVAPGLGINNNGQVVLQNYFYSSGTLTPLPANFQGAAINANGQVAGTILETTAGGSVVYPYAAIYSNGTVTNLPPDYTGMDELTPGMAGLGINDSGEVVGSVSLNGNAPVGWLYNGTTLEGVGGVPSLADCSGSGAIPQSINDSGDIAGAFQEVLGGTCAFAYIGGTYFNLGPGAAYAINASGQVTGTSWTINAKGLPTNQTAFIYSDGSLKLLPAGAVVGYGINAGGFIVGDGATHAFFWNGVVNDLNTFVLSSDPLHPFVTLTGASGINDAGVVLLTGVDSRNNASHTYLLQVPLVQVAPGPLTFPSTPVGGTSAPQTLTFTNAGASALALGTAVTAGAYTIQSNNCGSSLAAAAACMISVAYTPTASASPAGTLTLPAGGVPIAVPLSTALTVSITSSSSTTTTGTAVTLSWTATPGASCTATGGSSSDGWTGTLSPSGSKAVTEATAASYNYGITCTAGVQTQSAQVSVTVSWAPVTVALTASATTLYTGQSTTLTWSSKNATTCTSSGGGSNDGWPNGSRPTSGSVVITEPNPVISGGSETLTFTLTCTSSVSNLSGAKSVKVVQLNQPPPSSGGGGAFDPLALVFLFGILAAPRMRRTVAPSRFETCADPDGRAMFAVDDGVIERRPALPMPPIQ